MNKAKLKEEFSQLLDGIENLHNHESFYDYESDFVSMFYQFGKNLFESSLGKQEHDRCKKKHLMQATGKSVSPKHRLITTK